MEKVRCKVVVNENDSGKLRMHTVYPGQEENDKFFEATPHGEIELGILNEAASAFFVPGKEYYVDFIAAPTNGEASEPNPTAVESADTEKENTGD